MFATSPKAAVHDSKLGIETHDSVFSILAWGVRIEFRVPAALSAELPTPIVHGAEFGNQGPADEVLSVQVNHSAEGQAVYAISENGVVLFAETSLQAVVDYIESWAQLTVATLAFGPREK